MGSAGGTGGLHGDVPAVVGCGRHDAGDAVPPGQPVGAGHEPVRRRRYRVSQPVAQVVRVRLGTDRGDRADAGDGVRAGRGGRGVQGGEDPARGRRWGGARRRRRPGRLAAAA